MLNIAERFSHIAERLELPPEAAGSPQVLVSGRRLVTVEGHRGIRLYGPERIEVRTRSGCAAVRGRDLQVCFMSPERLLIRGRIDAVILEAEA